MMPWLAALAILTQASDLKRTRDTLPPPVSTSPHSVARLVHTRWTAKDGAPGVVSLAQTTDGYLWIGTASGLVRFDGARFVPFVPRGGDTLPSLPRRAQQLLAARDGSLWVVWLMGAVSRLRDGRITTWGERDGLPSTFALTESGDGVVVAGTTRGISRFADGKWEDVGRTWGFPGTQSKALWFDRDDVLWAQTQDRIVYRPKGAGEFVDPGLPHIRVPQRATFDQEADGTIWMSELNRSAHTLRRIGEEESRPLTEVLVYATAVLVDRKGHLWVASASQGLRRVVDPGRIRGRAIDWRAPEAERLGMAEGLLADGQMALLEDREGNVWVGSAKGLERFREGAFTPFAIVPPGRPRLIFSSRDTALWTSAYLRGAVLRIDARGRDTTIATTFGVYSLAEDSTGAIWTVDSRTNVLRLENGRFTPLRLRSSTARSLGYVASDSRGAIWIMDDYDGLFRLVGDSLVSMTPPDRLREPVISQQRMYGDRSGRMWVGQLNRVAVHERDSLRIFGAEQGVRPGVVYGIVEDRAGNVWVAGDGGVSRYEGGRFRSIAEHQGIPGASVFGLVQDESGAWWLATRVGMVRIPPGDMERAVADSTHVVRSRVFGPNDGIPGQIATSYWSSILTRAVDGKIWVATDSGVGVVDPRRLTLAPPPPVLVEAARIDGRELSLAEASEIPAGRHDLEIDYTATSLATPERVRFRYRLDGVDDAWRDAGTQRRAHYGGLAPGHYRFRVAATIGDDVWNEVAAPWSFRVLPAWYQTLWFRIAAVLVVGALGAAAAAFVQRRRHLRAQAALKAEYEATLAERARIAQDLHDTLLQGFAGVTLQLKGAALALPERPDVAAETIARVQRLAHESLREARESVWDMHEAGPGTGDLPSALAACARERTAGTGIEIAVASRGTVRRLSRALEDTAFRIGREAIANAVRHAQPRTIEVAVEFGSTTLGLEVRDDGRGFTSERGEEARRTGHFGLSGIRERAMRAGGRCEVRAQPGAGTVVAVELPLSEERVLPPPREAAVYT